VEARSTEARLFRSARMRSEMEQRQAAGEAGVEPGTMCKYEKGDLPIPSQVVVRLYNTRMGRTRPFYQLLCTRCEVGKVGLCDGTQCPVGQALDRRRVSRMLQSAVSEMAVA
jgi:DNA invertase Pin-like site-specific DNA recombinase